MFESIKRRYINWQIRSKQKKRNKAFVNFLESKKVVVLLALDSPNNTLFDQILKKMTNKEVSIWCYLPNKKYVRQDYDSVTYFNPESVSFLQKPNKIVTNKFLAEKPDLLIDLTLTENLPLKYLVGVSNATCRSGMKKDGYNLYDFEICQTDKLNRVDLFEQILYYLSTIRMKN